jgi:hypothetical protein
MRHLIGIVLAVAMTAAVFFAATWGYTRFLAESSGLAPGTSLLSDHRALFALGALAGTGLLAGILIAAPRISPLAAGLPGLLLLGLTVFYLVNVRRADELIPLRSHVFGAGLETLLARGVLGAAGLAMIVPLFVPSRWRGRRSAIPVDELGPAGDETSTLLGVIPGIGGIPVPSAGPGNPVAPTGVGAQPGPPIMPVYPIPPPYTASPTLAAMPETTQDGLPRRDPPQGIVY